MTLAVHEFVERTDGMIVEFGESTGNLAKSHLGVCRDAREIIDVHRPLSHCLAANFTNRIESSLKKRKAAKRSKPGADQPIFARCQSEKREVF
jgi:hypothetical protein